MAFNTNIAYQDGWDLAYSSSQQHEVGVIDPDLLPSKTLLYRYYFNLNPQIIAGQGSSASLGSFLGGVSAFGGVPQINIATDYIMFDLDFVVSGPVWNQLITATTDNVSVDILTLPLHVIDVAYVFKVTLDADGNISKIVDSTGANPVDPSTLPNRPNENSGKHAWFEFYDQFENNSTWSTYNRFQGKQGSLDQDYTLEHKGTANQTNSKRIKVKNLAVGDHYIVSYEGIQDHLFRHHVDMTFETIVISTFGVNLSGSNMPWERVNDSRFAHYLWKEWKDKDGKSHEGWRVTETWQMNANSHKLTNEGSSYDPVTNPINGKMKYSDWSMYNMTDKNLMLKDSERVGYPKTYAEYLKEKALTSTLTEAAAIAIDTNEVTPLNVHPSNFKLGYVADNIVNYSGGGYGFVQQGGATGILFKAITTEYYGFFLSNYYKRRFPKNTRIVGAYNRIRHGGNGRVIEVLTSNGGQHVTALEDPMFFMTIGDNLYYHCFNDDFTKIMMSYRNSQSKDEVEYSGNKLIGAAASTRAGSYEEPGKSVFITDTTDTDRTYNDDSNLTSSPTIASQPTSLVKYLTSIGTISDSTASYPDKPKEATKVFRVAGMASGTVLNALRMKFTSAKSSALLRIKGVSSGDDREMFGVSMPMNKEYTIDIGAWDDMSILYIMADVECTLKSCKLIQLDPSLEKGRHLINGVTSMAAATTRTGNNLLYYTDSDGRLNVIYTSSDSLGWKKYENILMRGDEISDIRGVPNMEEDTFFIFHFYKDALLCVPMDTTIFMASTDSNKRVESLDTIRRQPCYLVWGNAIKDAAKKETKKDSSGKYTYEDLNDNVIFTRADNTLSQSSGRSVLSVNSSASADTSVKDMSAGNKFINIGKTTASEGLATSEPKSTDYCVFMNKKGALRLFIEHEDSAGKTVIRHLNSYDRGLNWEDGWKYQKTNPASITEHVVRVNYLSDEEDSEEGTNISLLYNDAQDIVYIFYFYLGAVLCKPIADHIFHMTDLDRQADIINSIPIYAVAGNIESVIGESNYETLAAGSEKHVLLNSFQRDPNNLSNYYSSEYYNAQPISGYCTKGGYMRVFLVNSNNTVDGYFYDGGFWMPDKAVLI